MSQLWAHACACPPPTHPTRAHARARPAQTEPLTTCLDHRNMCAHAVGPGAAAPGGRHGDLGECSDP
eukprot:6870643-Pyramimonas_sp.AAC.1